MLLKHLSGDGKFVAPTSAEVTKHRKSGLAITRCISQERVWPEQRSGCQCSQRSNCLSPGNQVSLLCFHSPYVRSEIDEVPAFLRRAPRLYSMLLYCFSRLLRADFAKQASASIVTSSRVHLLDTRIQPPVPFRINKRGPRLNTDDGRPTCKPRKSVPSPTSALSLDSSQPAVIWCRVRTM